MHLSITLVIIIITSLISIGGFTNNTIYNDLIFEPPSIAYKHQWYRFITCGLIHADPAHLIFNMIALYFFGDSVEMIFKQLFGSTGGIIYLLLYISALVLSLLPTYFKHKRDDWYRSLGASGAVSAVVFAGLVLIPSAEVYLYFIPIPIPGFIFAPLYLLLSFILARKGKDNVNHSAHIWGSIYGALFVVVSCMAIGFPVIQNFSDQVIQYMHAKGWMH